LNQILLDNCQRKLCEIELLEKGVTVANPVLNTWELLQGKNLLDGNIRKLPKQERSLVNSYILNQVSVGCYDIVKKKSANKSNVEGMF